MKVLSNIKVQVQCAIQLSEQGHYFILKPIFTYGNAHAEWNNEQTISSNENGKIVIIQRDKEAEHQFVHLMQDLHPNLRKPEFETHFAIHSKHALQKIGSFFSSKK